MAENKGILVVKSAQKYAGRAKEKVSQEEIVTASD